MERLSATKKMVIVRQHLSGLSYDEIATRSKVSKGTVSNVVADLKGGRVPEAADIAEHIELLRELSVDLRRANLTPGQCATGLAVLDRIKDCGLEPGHIERWPLILKSASSESEAQELVRVIYSIEEVLKKTGLSLEELQNRVDEMGRKAANLESVSRQCEEYERQLAGMTKQRDRLANEVDSLEEKYKLLNPRVKDLEQREQTLSHRTQDMQARAEKAEASLAALNKERRELQEVGLSLKALAEFSGRVQSIAQRRNIAPEELRQRLLQELENLDQTMGLEVLVQSQKSELEEYEQAVSRAKQEQENLKAVVSALTREKTSLEASIKETGGKVSKEIAKIVPAANTAVSCLLQELRRGHNEALADVRRLRSESLEVGNEIGKCEQIIQVNQWLNELLALTKGDQGIGGKQVRAILLLVLRGFAAWLKGHGIGNAGFSPLLHNIENLIGVIEQWKV